MPEVLLIDDSPTQLHMREAVLRDAGFSVTTVGTAGEALQLLAQSAFAASLGLILTDHMLPELSGAAFVRQLRGAGARVPVIVISGAAEAEDEYRDLDVRFLHKPCPPEDLIAQVASALKRPH